jgi:hypothetical protein
MIFMPNPATLLLVDKLLKDVYLPTLKNQIDVNTDAFATKLERTSEYIPGGRQIVLPSPVGVYGGYGASSETGPIPTAGYQDSIEFKQKLTNQLGNIEITDKTLLSTKSESAAVVNLLSTLLESMKTGIQHNFARQIYGNGKGHIGTVKTAISGTPGATIALSTKSDFILVGSIVTVYTAATGVAVTNGTGLRVIDRDLENDTITLSGAIEVGVGDYICIQGSKDLEMEGLECIFDTAITSLYGLTKASYNFLKPYQKPNVATFDWDVFTIAMAEVARRGANPDLCMTTAGVMGAMAQALEDRQRIVNSLTLDGGFKAIEYNGLPITESKFIKTGELKLLNSKDFKLHQLADWRWLSGNSGNGILSWVPNSTHYQGVMAKYCNLMCERPAAQGNLTGISELTVA